MDFEKIILSKLEMKILRLIKVKGRINIYQIHGYLNFPLFEYLLISIRKLERLDLILKSDFANPPDYLLTENGLDYLYFLKRSRKKSIAVIIPTIAGVVTILAFVLEWLLR